MSEMSLICAVVGPMLLPICLLLGLLALPILIPALARLTLAGARLLLVLALGFPLAGLVLVLGEWGAFTRRPLEPWRVASDLLSLDAWREWNEDLD